MSISRRRGPSADASAKRRVERHDEAAPGRRTRDVARLAAVAAGDLTDERQPQAGSGALAAAGKPVEGLEHSLALGVGNPRPLIADA